MRNPLQSGRLKNKKKTENVILKYERKFSFLSPFIIKSIIFLSLVFNFCYELHI
jgi:hypothetical protein